MRKQVYISADYDITNGDQSVVDVLHTWGNDNKHLTDFVDTAQVVSGSVSKNSDCRICDLKREFNDQINVSSYVIFVIGDKTAQRTAGSLCERQTKEQYNCYCTPYKQNINGVKQCKWSITYPASNGNIGNINTYSYLRHEFEQSKAKEKNIIVVYNSLKHQPSWLPSYMSGYEKIAEPFWITSSSGSKIGNYEFIKKALGF